VSRKIKIVRFEALEHRLMLSATPVGDERLVNDFTPRVQSTEGASMAAAASGNTAVIVYEGKGPRDRQGVFAEILAADGQTLTPSFQVNSTLRGEQFAPAVAAHDDGAFVVAWAGRGPGDKEGVFFQRYNSAGIAQGGETLANETVGGRQSEPAVAIAVDGSLVVTWSGVGAGDVSGVFLRKFDASGAALAGEVLVNSQTADHQSSPSVAFDGAGSLVVAWQSRHQDGSDWGVYAQLFDSVGARIGSETRLNATTDASQSAPAVAADPEGGVVVAWQSRGQDGDGWGVVARAFDETVTPSGDEVVLNTTSAGHQERVTLAVAADGQWLAAWSSGAPEGAGWEAVARSFEADGGANEEVLITAAQSGANSGHQRPGGLAVAGDAATVVWAGAGEPDRHGVYAQAFVFDVDNGVQQSPDLAPIGDATVTAGEAVEVIVTATDPNPFDTLTFLLDPDNSPSGATLEPIGTNSARLRWTPPASAAGQSVLFRVLVIDDGEPPLADAEDFIVMVAEVDAEMTDSTTADEAFASFE
jgi:hypothetical protein